MHDARERAVRPEEITRLIVERVNAGDAEGVAALYTEDAVMAFPPGTRPAPGRRWRVAGRTEAGCGSWTGPTSDPDRPVRTVDPALSFRQVTTRERP